MYPMGISITDPGPKTSYQMLKNNTGRRCGIKLFCIGGVRRIITRSFFWNIHYDYHFFPLRLYLGCLLVFRRDSTVTQPSVVSLASGYTEVVGGISRGVFL
jgi:hypothetical protein